MVLKLRKCAHMYRLMYIEMTRKATCRLSFLLFMFFTLAVRAYGYDSSVDTQLTGTNIFSGTEQKAALAFDGDASTYYSTNASDFGWVGLDLGEPHVITRVGYMSTPTSQGADRMLLSLFEGANSPDFMDAVPLFCITSKPIKGSLTLNDVNVSRGFRYVRYVGSPDSYCNIAELQFYGHAGEGDDSQFYQITNIPTLSIEDFESQSLLIYEGGTMVQEYPVLFRVRGNYSSSHENKAFRIKYNDDKSHHMMKGSANESPTKCKKWVLINSYRDKTLMRNPVAWAMSRRGEKEWTPWSQIVDLVVNGSYWGTYTLADAVSIDRNRIDITEMSEFDVDEETITGGYYVEVDNNASREPYWFSSSHGNPVSVHEPDEEVIQPVQFQYITNYWNNMENIVFGSNYTDPEAGLRSVLDIESFCRHFLISEFNGNTDMLCQVFYFKERGDDHFYTGPIWDADLALENDQTTYPANERMDWTYKVRDTGNWTQFVGRVLSDQSVFANLQEMWAKLRKKGNFEPDDLAADVDSIRNEIRASANLNFIRWPYLNQWLSLNPEVPGSWEAEVDRVRNYVYNRVAWMDEMLSYGKVRQDANGVYQIASALDLCTFSQMVNEAGETNAKAALVTDIDMRDYNDEFQPIGTRANPFSGAFDGKEHTIRNLNISSSNTDAIGLFGYVSGCTFKDIIFDETCHVEGKNYVGMLAGYSRGNTINISGVANHGTVTASEMYAGGLVGSGTLSSFNFTNCYNTGTITAQSNAAAIIAPNSNRLTVTGCYNIGTIVGATEGKEFAFSSRNLTINNCWDYTSTQTNNMTPTQVDNGYLCYQLNYNAGGNKWRQNLDNGRPHDAYPVLRKNAGIVYEKGGRYTNINGESAKYRYYNLVVTKLQGGSNGSLQFCEFDILDETLSEVEGLSIYAGPNGYNNDEGWQSAADNNVNTKYCGQFQGNAYFLFDAGSAVDAFGYRIYTANDTDKWPERNPSSWKLYGSNFQLYDPDDAGWALIDTQEDDWTLGATSYTPYDFYIPHALETLTVNPQSTMLEVGGEVQLEASYTPAAIQNVGFQWTSTNEEVATVDENGHVVAVGLGQADIILSVPNYSTLRDTCTVTVLQEIPGHRYYMLAIDEIVDGPTIQFCEFDLLDNSGNEVKPLTFISATGTYIKDHDAGDLFDDDIYTKYCAEFVPTLYIYMDAGQRVTLSGYRITTAKDAASYPGRNPKTWSLFGSNTLSEVPSDEVWTLLDRREGDTTLGATNFTPYDFFFTYPQPIIPGDVNGDGEVDDIDYTALKLYIVGKPVKGFVPEAADLNGDGIVNAQDLVLLMNIINN